MNEIQRADLSSSAYQSSRVCVGRCDRQTIIRLQFNSRNQHCLCMWRPSDIPSQSNRNVCHHVSVVLGIIGNSLTSNLSTNASVAALSPVKYCGAPDEPIFAGLMDDRLDLLYVARLFYRDVLANIVEIHYLRRQSSSNLERSKHGTTLFDYIHAYTLSLSDRNACDQVAWRAILPGLYDHR